ncbi:MAG: NmrA family NAD(P)-binding protein [Saprospiraceae bacterium]|nr:NmrA family NAD(P)-binding protein [Saprospiraceae bacterium]
MKIVLNGSLGNISKLLAKMLVENGHTVTVISSRQMRQPEIEEIGAVASIGTMENIDFLTRTYAESDIVYIMETLPPNAFHRADLDFIAANTTLGKNHKEALVNAGIKQVIHLSSVGAHTNQGIGILEFHYNIERILRELPEDVSIKFMRPVGFYNNMFGFINSIKKQGSIVSNYGGDKKEPWVSPLDIATTIAKEIQSPFRGRTIHYIVSDEVSPNEVASTLGKAIGKPDLKWQVIPSNQFLNGLINSGMNARTAQGFTEMNESRVNGILYEDYNQNRPKLGKIKIESFAEDFAKFYHS